MSTDQTTGGQLLVSCLDNLGAKTSFGVPGESYLAVLDALYDADIQFVLCRQEGAASFAAAAWGKLTGQPGICFVTRGPGATNASIGVHTAMQDSSPMILFVGQVGVVHKEREAFQEVDYRAFFGSMAKWATEIDEVDRLPEIIGRAWRIALSGRPGPVVIALPEDMLTALTSAKACQPVSVAEAGVDHSLMGEVAAVLSAAERPLVLAGGGGWTEQGRQDLQAFCERETLAMAAIFRYHDIVDNHSPCYVGDAGVGMAPHIAKAIAEADVILAVNARFGEATTKAWTLLDVPNPKQRIIQTHASDRELGKIYQPEIAFHAGPNQVSSALLDISLDGAKSAQRKDWLGSLKSGYESSLHPPPQDSPVDMAAVMSWLQDNLADDVIITNGAGNFALWPNKVFCYGPNQSLLAPQSGAMGYGLPAAIAASLACPERQVVCFAGDGDIQMGLAELGTAVQSGARPVILLLNNGSYGTIRMHQERDYPGRISGTTLVNPDFTAVAMAYGMAGVKVATTEAFADAFAQVAASPTGGIIELDIAVEAITPRTTLTALKAGR